VAGGVGALARALGISQPSVSGWRRVPSDRALEIERIFGINRHRLRPDLYPEGPSSVMHANVPANPEGDLMADVDELDRLRAAEYGLLALLLFKAPTADVLERVAELSGDGSPLGMTHRKLAQAARDVSAEAAGREFFNLFIGVGRSELLPYASYYMTGFLHERPLAHVRAAFVDLGIMRQDKSHEPEDHIALLLDVMSNLAVRSIGEGYESEKAFFSAHLQPWAARFFADLESMQKYPFYAAVGAVGRLFMEIEEEGFSFGA
jgi:TorA maturation chaperone TorD/DNA-binding transcriptional regulator YdaS (Cro superfamily)